MVDSYPYIQGGDKFKEFLFKIKEMGIPNEFGKKQLRSLGYTSSNDLRFIQTIKFIGLVENKRGGGPTDLWKEMRTNFSGAITEGIRQGYSDLFHQYPDAYRRDDEALNSFFAANTTAGSAATGKMVTTFKTLCSLAAFTGKVGEAEEVVDEPVTDEDQPIQKKKYVVPSNVKGANAVTVNINVQLQLPSDETGKVYDKFFQAMRKHLMPGDE